MGAKQGRTKGNKQKAKYLESDRKHGKPGWKEEEEQKSEKRICETEEANCEAENGGKEERKKQKLSS